MTTMDIDKSESINSQDSERSSSETPSSGTSTSDVSEDGSYGRDHRTYNSDDYSTFSSSHSCSYSRSPSPRPRHRHHSSHHHRESSRSRHGDSRPRSSSTSSKKYYNSRSRSPSPKKRKDSHARRAHSHSPKRKNDARSHSRHHHHHRAPDAHHHRSRHSDDDKKKKKTKTTKTNNAVATPSKTKKVSEPAPKSRARKTKADRTAAHELPVINPDDKPYITLSKLVNSFMGGSFDLKGLDLEDVTRKLYSKKTDEFNDVLKAGTTMLECDLVVLSPAEPESRFGALYLCAPSTSSDKLIIEKALDVKEHCFRKLPEPFTAANKVPELFSQHAPQEKIDEIARPACKDKTGQPLLSHLKTSIHSGKSMVLWHRMM